MKSTSKCLKDAGSWSSPVRCGAPAPAHAPPRCRRRMLGGFTKLSPGRMRWPSRSAASWLQARHGAASAEWQRQRRPSSPADMGKDGPPKEAAKAKNSALALPSFAGVHARGPGAHGVGPGGRNRRRHVHVRDALYHQPHLQLPLLSCFSTNRTRGISSSWRSATGSWRS